MSSALANWFNFYIFAVARAYILDNYVGTNYNYKRMTVSLINPIDVGRTVNQMKNSKLKIMDREGSACENNFSWYRRSIKFRDVR